MGTRFYNSETETWEPFIVGTLASGTAIVEHGDDPNYPRPEGYAFVRWYGSVEPLNAEEHDEWVETT